MKATNIYFINEDGERDATQFDTTDINELKEIWWDFCKENGIIIDTEVIDSGEYFDVDSYDDVVKAAELIGLDPNAPSWDMDDVEIIKKANKKLKESKGDE